MKLYGYAEKNILVKLIYYMFLGYLVIDMITGGLLLSGKNISLSIPYKVIIICLCIAAIAVKKKLELVYILGLIILICFTFLLNGKEIVDMNLTVKMALRIIMYPIVFYYFKFYYEHSRQKQLKRIVTFNNIVIMVNMFLAILGFGYNTYNSGDGLKGFFYDANALSASVFCLFVYFYSKNKSKIYVVIYVLLAILIGTKAAMLVILLFYLFDTIWNARLRDKIFMSAFIIGLYELFVNLFMSSDIFDYQMQRYKYILSTNGNNVLDALTSRRYSKMLDVFSGRFNIMKFLFGHGYTSVVIELDFFDVLYAYGIIVAVMLLVFYLYIIYINRNCKEKLIFNIIYLILSFVTGHIWFNTTSLVFFCVINVSDFLEKDENTNKIKNQKRRQVTNG